MRNSEIELWANTVIDQVNAKQPNEDSRVELKAEWPIPQKAARRIAAHSNAARGENILWIIGLDEKQGLVGAKKEEWATWWPAVEAEFDEGVVPSVQSVLNIPVAGNTVVVILFETNQPPYVVKNPTFGNTKGEGVSCEIPWRNGAMTRTAKRSELLKLLVPISNLPVLKVISGWLAASIINVDDEEYIYWKLDSNIYIVPKGEIPLVIPFFQTKATFEVENSVLPTRYNKLQLSEGYGPEIPSKSRPHSLTLQKTTNELIVQGPGNVHFTAEHRTNLNKGLNLNGKAKIVITFIPADSDIPVNVEIILPRIDNTPNLLAKWEIDNRF